MRRLPCALLIAPMLLPALGLAETWQDSSGNTWDLSGFVKIESSRADTAPKIVSPGNSIWTYDARNAFLNAGTPTLGNKTSSLALQQLSGGVTHETEGALKLEARATYRWRSTGSPDQWFSAADVPYRNGRGLVNQDWYEKLVGVARPDLGSVRYGTQLSRAWARSDSFSYPIGLANQWAGTGAGFGILPEALRLTSRPFEDGIGKLTVELTLGRDRLNTDLIKNRAITNGTQPTEPRLVELFLQYSRERHLIEFTLQSSTGARQSSFGKSPLVGWIGDADSLASSASTPRRAGKPSQSAAILQGNYWPQPQNMLTYGLRHNRWSGSAANCNYDAVLGKCLFGVDPGFNYGDAVTDYTGFRGSSFDAMLGWSHYQGLFTYTAGAVYFGRASSDNPIEWGQSNSAISLNFGVYRKLPEVHKGASVYTGLGWSRFSKLGPAPLSMPDNQMLGINSLFDKTGAGITVGFNLVF